MSYVKPGRKSSVHLSNRAKSDFRIQHQFQGFAWKQVCGFNWHAGLQAHRRLNLIVYLREDWSREWGGAVEIWNEDATQKLFALSPDIGNALLFATTDKSYHGHPDPLECPDDRYRMSIAMYYYTKDRPEDEVVFGTSEMTNYVERPGETFDTDRLRRAVHKLKLGIKKLFA